MKKRPEIPKVFEVMTKKVKALGVDYTVVDALSFFNKMRISSAPVVNDEGKIMGFLSDSDCLQCLANCLFYDEIKEKSVGQIMKIDVVTINENSDLFEVENQFVSNRIRHAPVMNKDGNMVGYISRRDILKKIEDIIRKTLEYKKEIKEPIELDLHAKMMMIANR